MPRYYQKYGSKRRRTVKRKPKRVYRGIRFIINDSAYNRRVRRLPRAILSYRNPQFKPPRTLAPGMKWSPPYIKYDGQYRKVIPINPPDINKDIKKIFNKVREGYNTYKEASGVVGDLIETIVDPRSDPLSKGIKVMDTLQDANIPDMIKGVNSAVKQGVDYFKGRVPPTPYGHAGYEEAIKNPEVERSMKHYAANNRGTLGQLVDIFSGYINNNVPPAIDNHIDFVTDLFSKKPPQKELK